MLKKIVKYVLPTLLTFNFQASAINVKDMSLEEKLGQMICLSFQYWNQNDEGNSLIENVLDCTPVTEINDEIKEIIAKYHIGNVILLPQNFVNKEQSKKLVSDLQDAAKNSGNPPLIIAVDQEGGAVERFSFERSRLKNNSEIKSSKEAYEKGTLSPKN